MELSIHYILCGTMAGFFINAFSAQAKAQSRGKCYVQVKATAGTPRRWPTEHNPNGFLRGPAFASEEAITEGQHGSRERTQGPRRHRRDVGGRRRSGLDRQGRGKVALRWR